MKVDTLYIVMAVQYVFWAIVFLFIKKENRNANICLGLYLFSHASLFFYFYQAYSGLYKAPNIFSQLYWVSSAGHNPLLYLYILHYVKGKTERPGRILLHFLPSVIITTVFIIYYLSLNSTGRIELTQIHMSGESHNYLLIYKYTHAVLILQNMLYLGANIILIRNYKRKLLNFTANPPFDRIRWIKELILLTMIINIGGFVVFDMIPKNPFLRFYPLVHFGMIYYLLYNAVNQSKVFAAYRADKLKVIDDNTDYITKKTYKQICEELKQHMLTKELYKLQDLTIDKLSNDMNIPITLLLESINNSENKNYYQFVNALRVEEIKNIKNIEKIITLSIEELSSIFGFKSEKELTRSFKNHSQISIAQFQEQLINDN